MPCSALRAPPWSAALGTRGPSSPSGSRAPLRAPHDMASGVVSPSGDQRALPHEAGTRLAAPAPPRTDPAQPLPPTSSPACIA